MSAKRTTYKVFFEGVLIVFIASVGLCCLIGLGTSILSFIQNQQTFSKAYSDAAAAIASTTSGEKDVAQISIDHLEQLQQIQKNAASNDVMSFLYSTLSTILIGLCAGFVVKSFNNANEAKEAAQKSSEYYDTAVKEVEKTKSEYTNAIKLIQDMSRFLSIQVEILHAKVSLSALDYIGANKRIRNISALTLEIKTKNNRSDIIQLQNELLMLETAVDRFISTAECITDNGKKTSSLQAADRYKKELTNAVKYCDVLLNDGKG